MAPWDTLGFMLVHELSRQTRSEAVLFPHSRHSYLSQGVDRRLRMLFNRPRLPSSLLSTTRPDGDTVSRRIELLTRLATYACRNIHADPHNSGHLLWLLLATNLLSISCSYMVR